MLDRRWKISYTQFKFAKYRTNCFQDKRNILSIEFIMTCVVENVIGPLKKLIWMARCLHCYFYSHVLRKGLDRLMIARKMPTKREEQMTRCLFRNYYCFPFMFLVMLINYRKISTTHNIVQT